MPQVIVLDDLAQEGIDRLVAAEGFDYEIRTGLAGDALREALAEFDGAICRSGVQITAASLAGNRRLRAIVRAGVGTDNIDKRAATRAGVVVMNTPTGNTLSTAEHTIAMMLALSRNIAPAFQSLVAGRWDRKKYMGTQLADKTLGIVGLGRVGQAVARVARALQMHLVGYDPFLSAERAAELGIDLVSSVHKLLPVVDYLTVHTPLTDETRGMIGPAQLDRLKPGVRLVNCARGGIYDEETLAEGLKSGIIAGVALDVFEQEPCTASPLFKMPGVLCTPHLGASTEEAQLQVAVEAVGLLIDYLKHGTIRHAVNMAAIDRKTLDALRGHLDVAYRLGRLIASWHRSGVTSCVLRYRGEVAGKDTRLLTSAFAAGLLEEALAEEVNIVNSEMLLKERGIDLVIESHSEAIAFASTIAAEVSTQQKTYVAVGALLGNNMPRLVKLGEHRLEAYLDGILLIFEHRDVPGIIGAIGSILGRHGVNIAQMSVGRRGNEPGGSAIGVLNLDNFPPVEALDEMLQHPDIGAATVLTLPPAGEMPAWLAG
jgi:D-3-phosphoglycerate dehydrogenase